MRGITPNVQRQIKPKRALRERLRDLTDFRNHWRYKKLVEQLRNLPAPEANSHWTYMGGSYVLVTEPEGKIVKIYDGEIFYQH